MRMRKLILLIGDVIILYASLAIALTIRYQRFDLATFKLHLLPFSIIYLIWLIIFYIHNLYDLDIAKNNIEFSTSLIRSLIIGGLLSAVFFYFISGTIAPKTNLFLNILVFIVLFCGWRSLFNFLIGSLGIKINLAFIGYTPQIADLAKEIIKNPQLGYGLKLIAANHQEIDETNLPEIKIINRGLENLKEILEREKIAVAVVAPEIYQSPDLIQNLFECISYKIDFINLSEFYEKLTQKVPLAAINQIWFVENISQRNKAFYELFKKIFDFSFAFLLLIITLPFWPIVASIIKLESPGPIFYKQIRIGQGGKPFKVIKFRSMVRDAEKDGPQMTQENDPRTTKFGRFLRKTRLDELPQLWNIIKGEMSFIGPRAERPEFHEELKRRIPFYQERYLIKPGLSGWAQIKHGYSSSIEDNFEKIQYDLYYVKNRSFAFDSGIILKTINIILRGRGR